MHIDTLYYVYVLCSPIRLDAQIIRIVLLYSMCFRVPTQQRESDFPSCK